MEKKGLIGRMRRLLLTCFISLLFILSVVESRRIWCEQELPDNTITTNCGNLILVDTIGNYTPYGGDPGYDNKYFTLNYTKPVGATEGKWQVKHGSFLTYNITIPDSCWNATKLRLRIYSWLERCQFPAHAESHPECWNGTDWIMIGQSDYNNVTGWVNYQPYNSFNLYDKDWDSWSIYNDWKSYNCGTPHNWVDNLYVSDGTSTGGRVYEQSLYWSMPECGDSICEPPENVSSCPQDCPGVCGDTICNPYYEIGTNCCTDCGCPFLGYACFDNVCKDVMLRASLPLVTGVGILIWAIAGVLGSPKSIEDWLKIIVPLVVAIALLGVLIMVL